MKTMHRTPALVTAEWLEANLYQEDICVVDVTGLHTENMQSYRDGHVPGAICWPWRDAFWDRTRRGFPDPEDFADRMSSAGISNNTKIVIYGDEIQFGMFGWWALRYCGHENVSVLDGGRDKWVAEGRPLEYEFAATRVATSYRPVARNVDMRIFATMYSRRCIRAR